MLGGWTNPGFLGTIAFGTLFLILGVIFLCGTCPIMCFAEPKRPVVYGPDGVTPVLFYKGNVNNQTYVNDYGIALSKEGCPKRLRSQPGGYLVQE